MKEVAPSFAVVARLCNQGFTEGVVAGDQVFVPVIKSFQQTNGRKSFEFSVFTSVAVCTRQNQVGDAVYRLIWITLPKGVRKEVVYIGEIWDTDQLKFHENSKNICPFDSR